MIAYAESSGVLAWLLGEPDGRAVQDALRSAERVVASTLTAVECARAVARGVATRQLAVADELVALRLLDVARRSWVTRELTGPVLERAGARFPSEPVRTPDAFHLATAALFHEALGGVTMISLDHRIRDNARALGMEVGP